jgi:hypothetical protein
MKAKITCEASVKYVNTGSGTRTTLGLTNNGKEGFPRGKCGRSVKLTTHIHLVPRPRIVELNLHSLIRFNA